MYAQHSTGLTGIPADQIILALQRLDADGQDGIARIIIAACRRVGWVRDALQDAIDQQIAEQRDLDDWIDREAALDLARHSDPYAGSKAGDSSYWTTQ